MRVVRLFAGASVEGDRGPLGGPAAHRHRLALLALLAGHHPRPVSRDKLVAWLWPERDTPRARNLLSQAVHALRSAFGHGAVQASGDELRLDPDAVTTDVIEFQEACTRQDWKAAVELYRGHFLDGFFLNGAPEFERWVEAQRARLRDSYRRGLEDLAEAAAGSDPEGAVAWWKRRLDDEPENSRVTLRLMEALEKVGERTAALQLATQHQEMLQVEFLASPDPAVAALAERLRTTPEPPAGPFSPSPGPRGSTGDGSLLPHDASPSRHRDSPAQKTWPKEVRQSGSARPRSGLWTGIAVAAVGLPIAATVVLVLHGGGSSEVSRIAVLPLANLTGDPGQDYFVAGLHDALIAELAKIDELTVYSRQSTIRYRGSEQPLSEIARELGVDALVGGSVFQGQDSVRITTQLVRARPEEHLWVGSHEGAIGEALALQRRAARGIAHAIGTRIGAVAETRLAQPHPVEPQAQESYLRGLYHLERASYAEGLPASEQLAELGLALTHLEKSVELDPEWATAHAKLALAYHVLASGSFGFYEDEYFPRARAAALRALELDDTEAQAHASLGFVQFVYEWDWEGAERSIRRALELDANSHHWTAGLYLLGAGRHDEAIEHFRRAQERNPLSERLKAQLVGAYACAERYDEAEAQALELHARVTASGRTGVVGDSLWLLTRLSRWHSRMGNHETALAMAEDLVARSDSPTSGVVLAYALALAGRQGEARAIADMAEDRVRSTGGVWRPAQLYAAIGETERALDMVEEAARARRSGPVGLRCTETFALLRDEPRMQALAQAVGFPDGLGGERRLR